MTHETSQTETTLENLTTKELVLLSDQFADISTACSSIRCRLLSFVIGTAQPRDVVNTLDILRILFLKLDTQFPTFSMPIPATLSNPGPQQPKNT